VTHGKANVLMLTLMIVSSALFAELPDHFDWRDVDGKNYMTPVKDQALCGSCWAFAAVGTVEARYNVSWDWPEYDIDLSEEQLVSTCSNSGSCNGGWLNSALDYIRDTGITDEGCFPYVDSDCPFGNCAACTFWCTNATCTEAYRCSEWDTRLWEIANKVALQNTVAAIKSHIYEIGPVAVCLDLDEDHGAFDEDGIWRCDAGALWYTHCVVLVGWDETDDYWIAKDSYGDPNPWNPGGDPYFKIGYGECLVQNLAYGVTLGDWGPHKFRMQNSVGNTLAWFDDSGNLVLKGSLSSGGECSAPSGSFIIQDSLGATVAYIDNVGNLCIEGEWSDLCIACDSEADAFVVRDSSDTDVAYIDQDGNLCLTGKLFQKPEE